MPIHPSCPNRATGVATGRSEGQTVAHGHRGNRQPDRDRRAAPDRGGPIRPGSSGAHLRRLDAARPGRVTWDGCTRWSGATWPARATEPLGPQSRCPRCPTTTRRWTSQPMRSNGSSSALAGIDPDTPVWNWSPRPDAGFYFRRMLHETSVHRWDAENAVSDTRPVDGEQGRDGVDEFFDFVLPNAQLRKRWDLPGGQPARAPHRWRGRVDRPCRRRRSRHGTRSRQGRRRGEGAGRRSVPGHVEPAAARRRLTVGNG